MKNNTIELCVKNEQGIKKTKKYKHQNTLNASTVERTQLGSFEFVKVLLQRRHTYDNIGQSKAFKSNVNDLMLEHVNRSNSSTESFYKFGTVSSNQRNISKCSIIPFISTCISQNMFIAND